MDPFTQILNAIWAQLEAHAPFTDLVKPGNRIKTIKKLGLAPADMAQVAVVPSSGGAIDLFNTSTSARIIQNYTIATTTRHITPEGMLFPVKWEIIKAMAKANDKLGLTDLVVKVRFADGGNESLGDDEVKAGWAGVLVVSVEFRVTTASLQA